MCTSPNYMFQVGTHIDNNMIVRPTLKFLGHHEFKNLKDHIFENGVRFVEVPCGKCLECRIQYARAWADRCVLEAKQSKFNYFVTLTYDDEHLPYKNSLNPDHLKRFMNLLRKHFKRKLGFDGKIRFFASGEYGNAGSRIMNPHYHLLLFNCPINDLSITFYQEVDGKLVRYDRPASKDNNIYFSKTIYDLWIDEDGHHLGQISVGYFSYDTAAYVSQYVTKKCNPNNDKIYEDLGIYPEFLRMSNRPGIGAKYFEDHPMLHDNGKLVIAGDGEAHLVAVPRYFDKLFVKKYGEVAFNVLSGRNLDKKLVDIQTYKHSKHDKDFEADVRDNICKKIHRQKTII